MESLLEGDQRPGVIQGVLTMAQLGSLAWGLYRTGMNISHSPKHTSESFLAVLNRRLEYP